MIRQVGPAVAQFFQNRVGTNCPTLCPTGLGKRLFVWCLWTFFESLIAHSRRLQCCELTRRPAKITVFSLGLLRWWTLRSFHFGRLLATSCAFWPTSCPTFEDVAAEKCSREVLGGHLQVMLGFYKLTVAHPVGDRRQQKLACQSVSRAVRMKRRKYQDSI